jgi:selenide, water dikinase
MHASVLPKHEIVLLGIGHTNAHILRMWRMQPLDRARLTCISNFAVATYSGMLPGVLAGQYPPERMEIDLVRLCAAAGARLIVGETTGIDPGQRLIRFADRPDLPYHVLSIGIGSTPVGQAPATFEHVLAIKPMQTFLPRLEDQLRRLAAADRGEVRLTIVGAGAGGVEIAFCLLRAVERLLGKGNVKLTLVSAEQEPVRGAAPRTRKLVLRDLERAHIELVLGSRVERVDEHKVTLSNGRSWPADLVIWATSASAPPLLDKIPLPRDEQGFLLTSETLQSVGDPHVFVVGDTGTIEGAGLPKAGVYAVRQGPVLWENLQRQLARRPLEKYRPQATFLKLLNTGNGRAIAEYRGFAAAGRWCWRLKDFIDGRFMDKYQDYRPMEMGGMSGEGAAPMRCAGCGGKVGGSVLSRVLARLDVPAHPQVLLGLERPDDAAVLRAAQGGPLSVTVDFFAAPLDDAYLTGRIAALNSASDTFAVGGTPVAALAIATLPPGPAPQQEQLLYELLQGGLEELKRMGATLIGGHTIEGPQLTIGYTILADQPADDVLTKGMLRPGDRLALTKPLGTGALLVAMMRAECRAVWHEPLLASMLASNQMAADCARRACVRALTDVTGFGLAGHLYEMLRASQVSAELSLGQLPLLPGAAELFARGLESTLAPDNRSVEPHIETDSLAMLDEPAYRALFDPQTSGGLLCGVPAGQVEAFESICRELQAGPIAWIGTVIPAESGTPKICVRR